MFLLRFLDDLLAHYVFLRDLFSNEFVVFGEINEWVCSTFLLNHIYESFNL